MQIKLHEFSAWIEDEIQHIQNGGILNQMVRARPNPPWLNQYVLRRVRLEEQRAKREAANGPR